VIMSRACCDASIAVPRLKPYGKSILSMTNVLHWIGVVLGLLVVAGGIHIFLRGLSLKPSAPSTRVPGKGRRWKT